MKEYTGEDVKNLRTRLDLTQEQMARRLGVTLFSVSRWERDKSKPVPSGSVQILLALIDRGIDPVRDTLAYSALPMPA